MPVGDQHADLKLTGRLVLRPLLILLALLVLSVLQCHGVSYLSDALLNASRQGNVTAV